MQLLGPWTDSGAISASAGGKARGLHILHNSGFAVPEWAVLGTDVFDAFATGAGLDEQIAEFAAAGRPAHRPTGGRAGAGGAGKRADSPR
ncbi:hypothetical protein [Nocardia cyriacigeorgica]|uniref:hypothetical protein n=1 Tax=Nocardia cyriacigeorgica TaxID=135487 RepID=UPI002457CBF4|nr:hypothetical protein [Nocardia cyriacigeorgica]